MRTSTSRLPALAIAPRELATKRRCIVAVFVALTAAALGAASRDAAPQPHSYPQLLDEYRRGDADAAVAEFAGWSRKDLDAAKPPDESPTTHATAAGLALEALIRATEAQQRAWPDRPSSVPAVLALADDAQKSGDLALVQFSHDWILAFEAYAARFNGPLRADGDAIQRANWTDPPLLLVRGAIAEQHMGPLLRLGGARPADDSGNRLALRRGDFDRGLSHDAETFARQAAAADLALVDAPLHLGRVIFLLGRDTEAQPILEQTLQAARAHGAVATSSLAALFLGQLHAENARPAEAREMFALAASLDPHAASARLGLGTDQLAAGDETSGWVTIAAMFGGPGSAGTDVDPYYLYPSPFYAELSARLAALRAVVRR